MDTDTHYQLLLLRQNLEQLTCLLLKLTESLAKKASGDELVDLLVIQDEVNKLLKEI